MSQQWRHGKPGKITIRQLPHKPAAHPSDVLQAPVVNSADPQLSGSSPFAYAALQGEGKGYLAF